jgi:tetratricopeptide (TPR) repeat protein
MKRLIAWGVLLAALGWTGSAHAGVYSSAEPEHKLNDRNYTRFREDTLIPLKQIGTPDFEWKKADPKNGKKDDILVFFAKPEWVKAYSLAGKVLRELKGEVVGQGPFTIADRLNISTCLLRMRDPRGAIDVLEKALVADPRNFLLMSNLGTAYMMAGDYRNAQLQLNRAWDYWRMPFAELSKEQQKFLKETMRWDGDHPYGWYARCEKYQLLLVRQRLRELGEGKGKWDLDRALRRVDDFLVPDPFHVPADFQPAQFSGRRLPPWEPGKISASERAKLPKDAVAVVQQLLVWTPEDARLIWLLAELLNAEGDTESAATVLSEFESRFKLEPRNAAIVREVKDEVEQQKILSDRFAEEYPIVANRMRALKAHNERPPQLANDKQPPSTTPPQGGGGKKPGPAATPTAGPLNVDWQTLGVGFGSGALLGFLGCWRLREALRRRQTRPPAATADRH